MGRPGPDAQEEMVSETNEKITEPPMYRVLLLNDDYTSMEFVVDILMAVFHKSFEESTVIMLKVHNEGAGICGIYTYEVAETKIETVEILAREKGFPLKCIIEKD